MDTLLGEATVSSFFPPFLFWKGSTQKGNNLLAYGNKYFSFWVQPFSVHGNKFFPLRGDPISEGAWGAGQQTGSHQSCLPCKKWQKNVPSESSPRKHLQSDKSLHILHTVNVLKFPTPVANKMAYETVQTQIRLLLKEQSDQGLHCLPFH